MKTQTKSLLNQIRQVTECITTSETTKDTYDFILESKEIMDNSTPNNTVFSLDTMIDSPRLIANGRGAQITTIGEQIKYLQTSASIRFDEALLTMVSNAVKKERHDLDALELEMFEQGYMQALIDSDSEVSYFLDRATLADIGELFDDPNIKALNI